ncbi:MAG: hypothetical protein JKY96_01345 [Phycisphaerales bacterium]|nr:hypothetical protein [Phycisphaerales bacterium]
MGKVFFEQVGGFDDLLACLFGSVIVGLVAGFDRGIVVGDGVEPGIDTFGVGRVALVGILVSSEPFAAPEGCGAQGDKHQCGDASAGWAGWV